jgi:uncharacterized membrane protein YfcA
VQAAPLPAAQLQPGHFTAGGPEGCRVLLWENIIMSLAALTELLASPQTIAIWLALGASAGFLGGLIGIGGGFVLVPGLYWLYTSQFHLGSAQAMPLALGTTMACIIFTAASSVRAQLQHGAVDLPTVRRFAPWVAPGCVLGALLATVVNTTFVKLGFAVFCLYSAARMLFFSQAIARPGASMDEARLALPGTFFGTVCGMLGVGGANLFVPFMMKRNLSIRKAMGTASALQMPIALVGSAAYMVLGQHPSLPAGSVGFVHLPALAVLVLASVVMAPLGVRATHALPVPMVKKVFAVFTGMVGLKMASVVLG